MAFLTNSVWTDFALAITALLFLVYRYLSSINNYWRDRGIPYVKPMILFGNLKDVFLGKRPINDVHIDIYNGLKGEKFGGYFEMISPAFMVRDQALIEKILIKDFSYFVDRGESFVNVEKEPLSAGLSLLTGNQWRNMRYKLTPTFTSGKLKGMFEQIYNCGEELLGKLEGFSKTGEAVESKTVLSWFTTDVIATCAFGLQFTHDSEDGKKFRKMADDFFSGSRIQMIRFFIGNISPTFRKYFGVFNFPQETNEYFINVTKLSIDYRKKNNIKRNDFLQLLLQMQEQEKNGKLVSIDHELIDEDSYLKQEEFKPTDNKDNIELSDEVMAAQAFLFLTAGAETVSMTTSLALYSIATIPEVQAKAQEELDNVLAKHGTWSYQALKEMTYLDQIVQEALRIHPFIVNLNRIATSPYQIPGTKIVLEKGTRVTIPVYPIHMDPQIYPDPHKFDPERFKDNNHKTSWKYLPFGDGPRMCIGMRFALLEMKLCLARILSRFSITLNDKTRQPLRFSPSGFFPRPSDGIWLNVQKRDSPNTWVK